MDNLERASRDLGEYLRDIEYLRDELDDIDDEYDKDVIRYVLYCIVRGAMLQYTSDVCRGCRESAGWALLGDVVKARKPNQPRSCPGWLLKCDVEWTGEWNERRAAQEEWRKAMFRDTWAQWFDVLRGKDFCVFWINKLKKWLESWDNKHLAYVDELMDSMTGKDWIVVGKTHRKFRHVRLLLLEYVRAALFHCREQHQTVRVCTANDPSFLSQGGRSIMINSCAD